MEESDEELIDDNDAWAEEFIRPYTNALSKMLSVKSWKPVSPQTVSLLTSAEDNFWAFICEFGLQDEEAGEIFNLYLVQTRILRMNETSNQDEMAEVALKCLGLGTLLLARMDEAYGFYGMGILKKPDALRIEE